jgi:hypothetical protein
MILMDPFLTPAALGLLLFCLTPLPAELQEAVPAQELLRDWQLQDCGADGEGCFSSADSAELEVAAIERVLAELGEGASEYRVELDELLRSDSPGVDRRWRDLYERACTDRRRQRLAPLVKRWPRIVFTRHFDFGGSHYAYTENLSDAQYVEAKRTNSGYRMGAALCLLELEADGSGRVRTLLEDPGGVIRDPAVSWNGERILFAWRTSPTDDDYHLYEMSVASGETRQLTSGLGVADYEGTYLPDGDIVFNSTRCVQTVDCWWTEVSNLYTCDPDGHELRRLTYDQVHDNYPQVLDDGRVTYTRWDYNDRGQVFPQALFQMNPDGTGQAEFYGNNSWFPTTILHARGIPGTGEVICVLSGHHNHQRGKLAIIDPARGRQEASGVRFIAPEREAQAERIDSYGQGGEQFQYPYPLSETEFLVTYTPDSGGNRNYRRPYGIYFMTIDGRRELLAWNGEISSNQPVPLAPREAPPVFPSRIDLDSETATMFVQDVYHGPGLAGVARGTIRAIRVVALEFRAAGIGRNQSDGPAGRALASTPIATGNGSWDVKRVLGTTPVHADGSAMFVVPARTPLYLQLLDGKGHVVQSMRSWTTLQPGEVASCVGCHEDPNEAARPGRNTMANRAGPLELERLGGESRGFSFQREIQPILDRRCVSCHHLGENRPESDVEFASFGLRDTPVHDPVSKRYWSEAYLALTGSEMTGNGIVARPGELVSWISAQSEPSMLPPRHAGATRSGLMVLLEEGHHGITLTPEELERVACWIDLAIPFCGDYVEGAAWTAAEHEKYEHFLAKRRRLEALEARSEDGSDYLVVIPQDLVDGGYGVAARTLGEHHGGDVYVWNRDPAALEKELLEREPRYLALVFHPDDVDANLPRRLLPILTRFDEDPFVDCAFGVITGATGEDAQKFVENILRAPQGELPLRKFETTSVVVDECMLVRPRRADGGVARSLETTELWVTGRDSSWEEFLASHRAGAESAGLVEWGHCGDSQGIWLFSMYRNMDQEKHWKYEPEKVGRDPDGEMPRMTPKSLLEGVDLFPAVVVNGSCHSAVTARTIVGPDIISTFGDTEGLVRFYRIEPEESFPLMAIRHGATAYIAPLAANNANRVGIEQWWILRGGAPLGEVMKRTYDELVMGSEQHQLSFELFEEGRPEPHEAAMFHDTAHRILFGDPRFVPWRDVVPTSHEVQLEWKGDKLHVHVHWKQLRGDPWVWDPWRDTRHADGERGRVYERIPLEKHPGGRALVEVLEAEVMEQGTWKPLTLEPSALLEIGLDGESVLHLKASGTRAEMNRYGDDAPTELRALFELTFAE